MDLRPSPKVAFVILCAIVAGLMVYFFYLGTRACC
jgi:hypothetical protein